MAEINSLTGAGAPLPHDGGPDTLLDLDDLQNNVHHLRCFSNLQEWICNVRDFLSGIELRRQHDPEFRAVLASLDYSKSQVDWDEDVADGLQALQGAIRDRIHAIRLAVEQGAQS